MNKILNIPFAKDANSVIVKTYCKTHGKGENAGKEFRLQIYDGFANYVVFSLDPVQLVHVPGSYESELAQYLPKERIIEEIEYMENLNRFFEERGK
jgi:hypothetical protein